MKVDKRLDSEVARVSSASLQQMLSNILYLSVGDLEREERVQIDGANLHPVLRGVVGVDGSPRPVGRTRVDHLARVARVGLGQTEADTDVGLQLAGCSGGPDNVRDVSENSLNKFYSLSILITGHLTLLSYRDPRFYGVSHAAHPVPHVRGEGGDAVEAAVPASNLGQIRIVIRPDSLFGLVGTFFDCLPLSFLSLFFSQLLLLLFYL